MLLSELHVVLLSMLESASLIDPNDTVVVRKDPGDRNSYWTGINWMGTKFSAIPIKFSEVAALERTWRTRTKCTKVINKLAEGVLQTVKSDDLWGQNQSNIADYQSITQYQVRPIPDSSPTKYEAFSVNGAKSTPFGVFNSYELSKTLEPIRPNQTPDVEGFTTYVDPLAVEAFQYTGEPCKLELSNILTVQLGKGDYVIRSVKGSTFEYSVEDENTFESTLRKS
jgi:hypothetical protein